MAKKPTNSNRGSRAKFTPSKRVEPDHSPISIPAGSFDRGKLDEGLSKTVDTYDNRQKEIDQAITAARLTDQATVVAPHALPDHKFVEVPAQTDADGNVIRTETIQVYDPSKSAQHQDAVQAVAVSSSGVGADENGKPTDLERLRMAAVKGDGLSAAEVSERIPVTAPSQPQTAEDAEFASTENDAPTSETATDQAD